MTPESEIDKNTHKLIVLKREIYTTLLETHFYHFGTIISELRQVVSHGTIA